MKTQILFDNGKMQILLVPETKTEESLLKSLEEDNADLLARIDFGAFTERVGGWMGHDHNAGRSMVITVCPKF